VLTVNIRKCVRLNFILKIRNGVRLKFSPDLNSKKISRMSCHHLKTRHAFSFTEKGVSHLQSSHKNNFTLGADASRLAALRKPEIAGWYNFVPCQTDVSTPKIANLFLCEPFNQNKQNKLRTACISLSQDKAKCPQCKQDFINKHRSIIMKNAINYTAADNRRHTATH